MSEPVKEGFNWSRVASGALNFIDGVISQYGEDKRAQINRQFQSSEAEKNRQFQQQMYDRQLDDNIAWRTHQEEYNTPEAQMQRYRDAGINPMYAVTGHGQNFVQSPMSMSSGFGSSPSGGASTSPIDSTTRRAFEMNRRVQENQMQNNTLVSEATANKLNAEADLARTQSKGAGFENVGKELEAQINSLLRGFYYHDDNSISKNMSYPELKAFTLAEAEKYQREYNGLSFDDAKARFLHSVAVRQFERDLNNHQRSKFQYELSQCKSASEVFAVSARWAVANQWINAGTQVVGAAAGVVGAVKGTGMMPTYSRSYSESFGDHTSRTFSESHNHNYNHNPYK